MLIEDDAAMQALIAGYLANYGFGVSAFGDPRAALDALRADANAFDIVVLDLMLPGMDGFDEQLKRLFSDE